MPNTDPQQTARDPRSLLGLGLEGRWRLAWPRRVVLCRFEVGVQCFLKSKGTGMEGKRRPPGRRGENRNANPRPSASRSPTGRCGPSWFRISPPTQTPCTEAAASSPAGQSPPRFPLLREPPPAPAHPSRSRTPSAQHLPTRYAPHAASRATGKTNAGLCAGVLRARASASTFRRNLGLGRVCAASEARTRAPGGGTGGRGQAARARWCPSGYKTEAPGL